METLLTKTLFTLSPGEVTTLSMRAAQSLHVEEASGTDVWVTRDIDSVDYWLRCGGSLMLARGEEVTLSVDPRAAHPVKLSLVAQARRPASSDAAHVAARVLRRLVRGTEWTPDQRPHTAA